MKIRLDRDDSCIHAIIRLAVLPSVSIIYVCILASIVLLAISSSSLHTTSLVSIHNTSFPYELVHHVYAYHET